jgi:hypothetical protein
MEKECRVCKTKLVLEKNWYKSNEKTNNCICNECISKVERDKNRSNKIRAVEYKGGKCENCGGEFHPSVFDFHHVNPQEKEFRISQLMRYTWEKQKVELDKCVLLCANCHRLEHHGDW